MLASAPWLQAQVETAVPSDDAPVRLKPFEVVEEQSKGYRVSSASTATRTNTPILEIPQTVDIVTREFWNDLGATSFADSFKYVANAYVRNRSAGGGDNVNLRGFETSGSVAVDGVRVGNYKRDLTGYDRLEIVKGPPSAVQGRAGGTGLMNYILKKPEYDRTWTTLKYSFTADEFDNYGNRIEADTNFTLLDKKRLAGRVAVAWEDTDDFIEYQKREVMALYPSLRWQLTDRTELVVVGEFLKTNTPPREEGHGFALYPEKLRRLIPAYDNATDPITALQLPYDFNVSGPGNEEKQDIAVGTLFLTHRFAEWLTYRQVAHWRSTSSDGVWFTGEDNTKTLVNSQKQGSIAKTGNTTTQGDLISKYGWKFVTASTLVGYSYGDNKGTTDSYAGVPDAPFNVLDLAAIKARGESYFNGRTASTYRRTSYTQAKSFNFGYYGEQNVGLFDNRIILTGGIRSDHDSTRTVSLVTGAQTARAISTLNSYRYGATVKLLPKLALYVVKSVQNDPTSTQKRYNGLLAGDVRNDEFFTVVPSTELEEIGLKADVFSGRLSLSGNYWQMTKEGSTVNQLVNGTSQGQPVTYGVVSAVSGAQSKGFEISAYGNITERLSVIANYTRMQTSQASPTLAEPGRRIPLRFAPSWNSNLFLRYSFRDQNEQGWLVKGGVSVIGPLWAQITGPGLTYLPHTQKNLDLGVAYRWRDYDFDLMVTNLANDPFFVTRDQPPRTYRFSVSTRF